MGLSPELQGYAENIWRRFPEVFISLGSPDVEDVFELHGEGGWSHRVIDTRSEKVIEIVLCRRDAELGTEGAEEVDLKLNEDVDCACDGEIIELDEDAVHTEIDKLSQALTNLEDRLEECSMVEVQDHFRRTEPSSDNRTSHSERTFSHPQCACQVPEPPSMDPRVALEMKPLVVPPSHPIASALAIRRGMSLPPVITQRLRPHFGPHCVQRLDTPVPTEVLNDGLGSHRSRASSRNNSSSSLCSRAPSAHPSQVAEPNSPGTHIQRMAVQRRQGSGSTRTVTTGELVCSQGDSFREEDVKSGLDVSTHGARPSPFPAGMHQGCSPLPCHLRPVAPVTVAATGALAAVGRSQEPGSPVRRSPWSPAASSLQTVGLCADTFRHPCQSPPTVWNSNCSQRCAFHPEASRPQ